MKADDPNLKPQYRMPRVFGALPGPRNVPKDKQHLPDNQTEMVILVAALTDARLLADLLPPHCMLAGEPLLTVSATFKSNIGWLAGRGYAILRVRFPIAYDQGPRGKLTGLFTPVQWENLADPIITGREELGFAKIYAEMPPPVALGNRYMATASWEGFRFFHIEAFDLEEAPTDPDQPSGLFHYKFIPKTASLGDADVSYLEYAPPNQLATGNGGLVTIRRMSGNGRFAFHRARWEDVPFQYPIINALNELPLLEVRSAGVTWHAARATIGNPSAGVLAAID